MGDPIFPASDSRVLEAPLFVFIHEGAIWRTLLPLVWQGLSGMLFFSLFVFHAWTFTAGSAVGVANVHSSERAHLIKYQKSWHPEKAVFSNANIQVAEEEFIIFLKWCTQWKTRKKIYRTQEPIYGFDNIRAHFIKASSSNKCLVLFVNTHGHVLKNIQPPIATKSFKLTKLSYLTSIKTPPGSKCMHSTKMDTQVHKKGIKELRSLHYPMGQVDTLA